jgi:hypothetical protein
MWYKPRRTLGGPGNVSIPAVAGAGFLDFEASHDKTRWSKAPLIVSCRGNLLSSRPKTLGMFLSKMLPTTSSDIQLAMT